MRKLQQELKDLRAARRRWPAGGDPEFVSFLMIEGRSQVERQQILGDLKREDELRAMMIEESIKCFFGNDSMTRAFIELCDPQNANLAGFRAQCWDLILDPYLEEGHDLPPLHFGDRSTEDWAILNRHYDHLLEDELNEDWKFEDCVLWAYEKILEARSEGRALMRHKKMVKALLKYGR